MYHCHLLRHEDDGMMGQFLLVEPGKESQVPMELPKDSSGTHNHH
jgi:suppressor of ftsI